MKKTALFLALFLTFTTQNAFAKKLDLTNTIKKSELDKTATIAVSLKDAKNGNILYQYNENKLLHPASVLKVLTLSASLDTLSNEYKYKTIFSTDNENNLYIKLSADPSLTAEQLKAAISNIKIKDINNLYIDDKVIDRFEWGIGWMWDDETNPRMAKISPYNLNQNILNVKIEPTKINEPAKITPLANGTASIINLVTTGTEDNIIIYRQNSISSNIVYIYGTVKNQQITKVPIGNPERFFLSNLTEALKSHRICTHTKLGTTPDTATPAFTIENEITNVIPQILKNSDNFYIETLFKTAGAEHSKKQGSFKTAKKMFDSYFKKLGLDTSKIIIADGSGVSRNNLFSADWITQALYKIQKDKNFTIIKENMCSKNEGTMKNRLSYIPSELKIKTGELANNKTIAGYITNKSGEELIFAIFISNYNSDKKVAEALQDKLITEIYEK